MADNPKAAPTTTTTTPMATSSTTVGAVASPPPTTTTAAATAHNPLPPPTDVLEERLIDEEYKVWKKNTPFLYDYVMTHSLEWPSLTCQWLPTTRRNSTTNNTNNTNNNNTNNNESLTEEHQLLIGTHTTGEQNYLMVASCLLPRPQHLPSHEQQQQQQQEQQQQHGDGTTDAKSSTTTSQRRAPKPTTTTTAALEYDHDKGEMGGYGMAPDTPTVGKITIHHKIPHGGEVNRARYMPQNPFVVASRGPNPDIYIWDRSKHPSLMTAAPSSTSTVAAPVGPQAVCVGHEREGYGMVWSVFHPGHLATASEDKTVRVWDVSRVLSSSSDKTNQQNTVAPLMTLRGHEDTVEDVDWHYKDPNLLVSVGGDRRICLWDRAHPQQAHFVVKDAHLSDINSVAFNPFDQHIFATGSSDQTIGIWDVRRLDAKLHSLENVHTDDVFTISWAPFHEAVLASGSADRRVAVWDLTRVGHEQSADDAADGPPELLFLHGGHTSKVSDVAWNPQAPWTLASTSEDNILQIWSMAEEIYTTPSLTAWDGIGNGGGDDNDAKGLARHELE